MNTVAACLKKTHRDFEKVRKSDQLGITVALINIASSFWIRLLLEA